MKEQRMSIKISKPDTIQKIRTWCEKTGMTHVAFAEMVIGKFFADERNMLSMMTKEELIDLIIKSNAIERG